MAKSLNVTSAGIQVVVTSYLIVISATILVFGRLGDTVGKTKVFKFGLALFTIRFFILWNNKFSSIFSFS